MFDVDEAIADLLEQLANGDSVQLGEFSDNASETTEADLIAERLREISPVVRAGGLA